ncbi:hypothetical protein BDP27DRAFT_1476217 [Rhodocollybia butyracea]|uniref:FAD/NAD(P)-binding domain-containing protein n=1 Tax=Rhodocollybia butyracea TaxID=206335 RepID=A0A9P5PKX0_9AGAR|nr:hypothetical protein BDP27DRAFT_1476217 [Rhodocollybia butyracea]
MYIHRYQTWLSFELSLCSLFHSHGWLRDYLVFTWNLRTRNGHAQILEYLDANIKSTTISGLEVTSDGSFKPSLGRCPRVGRGIFTLAQEAGEWKAFTFFISLDSLKGHEPRGPEEGVYHGTATYWSEVREERRRTIEENPLVLIDGYSTLVIEKNERIGDHWRRRYPCLTLHTPKLHHSLLYQPYPDTWPRFTPRDKVADWLEQYAISQDIVVWTKSQPLPVSFLRFRNEEMDCFHRQKWKIRHDSSKAIVLATGFLGALTCLIYSIPNLTRAGHNSREKRVVIVGTGNSGADIALDLHMREAQAVTILQRSTTVMLDHLWDPNLPVEVGDYRNVATPYPAFERKFLINRDILDGLAKAGMNVNIDGGGILTLVHERLGGMDIGTAEHVASGKIKVKSEVNAVILSDGSVLEADVVLFATGYRHMQSIMRRIFGETIDQAGPAGGMDEEGKCEAHISLLGILG